MKRDLQIHIGTLKLSLSPTFNVCFKFEEYQERGQSRLVVPPCRGRSRRSDCIRRKWISLRKTSDKFGEAHQTRWSHDSGHLK